MTYFGIIITDLFERRSNTGEKRPSSYPARYKTKKLKLDRDGKWDGKRDDKRNNKFGFKNKYDDEKYHRREKKKFGVRDGGVKSQRNQKFTKGRGSSGGHGNKTKRKRN